MSDMGLYCVTWSKHSVLRWTSALRMLGGRGSPVCWTLSSRGTPNTRGPFTSTALVFLSVLGTVLQTTKVNETSEWWGWCCRKSYGNLSTLKNCFASVMGICDLNQSSVRRKKKHNLAAVGSVSFWSKSQINIFWLHKSQVLTTMCVPFKSALQEKHADTEQPWTLIKEIFSLFVKTVTKFTSELIPRTFQPPRLSLVSILHDVPDAGNLKNWTFFFKDHLKSMQHFLAFNAENCRAESTLQKNPAV